MNNGNADTVLPLADRVAALRLALGTTYAYDEAMAVLSVADFATLRAIEPEFYDQPASIMQLRDEIAVAHMQRMAAAQAPDTGMVSAEVVAGWAYAALRAWLPGHTDFNANEGGQYYVTRTGTDEATGGQLYRVTTLGGADPRDYRVTITAQRVDGEQ